MSDKFSLILDTHRETESQRQFFASLHTSDWGLERVREFLDSAGLEYKLVESDKDSTGGDYLSLPACPMCGQAEGNPIAGVRGGKAYFKCFRATCNKTWPDLVAEFGEDDIVNLADMDDEAPDEPVLHGVIDKGEIFILIGGPKVAKTYFMMMLAASIGLGRKFLLWPTNRGRVLIIDNELRKKQIKSRFRLLAQSMGVDWQTVAKNVDIWSLRGKPHDLYAIRRKLQAHKDKYDLIYVDSMYKCYPDGFDENSNSQMAKLFAIADQIAEETGAAFGFVHHSSKGDQSSKKTTDIGAGAGAMIRAVDAQIVLVELKEENAVSLSGSLRSHEKLKPFSIEFDFPLWRVRDDVNPFERAKGAQTPSAKLSAFVELLSDEYKKQSEIIAVARKQLGPAYSKPAVEALIYEGRERGELETCRAKTTGSPVMIRRKQAA